MSCSENFDRNMSWAKGLVGLHDALSTQLTSAVDLSDLLRAALVFSVSAFDNFIHELVLDGMMDIFDQKRSPTQDYIKIRNSFSKGDSVNPPSLTREDFREHVRVKNQFKSFQNTEKIAGAVKSICKIEIWKEVASYRKMGQDDLIKKYRIIIEKRNVIVHQADQKPFGFGERYSIDRLLVVDSQEFLVELAGDVLLAALPPIPA